jgi:acetyl-CoA synthase
MSRYIATRAIRGANALVMEAEAMLGRALREKGGQMAVAFPNTAYYLPLIYGMTGAKVETLGDLRPALNHARELLHPVPSPKHWTPYLGETLDSGMATLIAAEVIEAVRFVYGLQPEPLPGFELAGGTAYGRNGNGAVGHLNGPIDDIQLRTWGIQLVDGRMPGFAAIVGCAKSNEVAVKLVRELQKRNILTFLSGNVNGRSIIHQLHEEGVTLGYDTYTVPFGTDTLSAIYALGFATRSALTFGGLKAGQARDILLYNRERVFAFVLALGEVDDLKYAAAAGAINFGFPVIADTVIPEILPTGVTQYEHVVSMPWNEIEGQDDLERAERLVQKCIEIRGVKIKLADVPVPVPYGSAFEGEVVRKNDMRVEFGGKNSRCFEYLYMAPMDEVVDGKIEVVGPDFSQIPDKGAMDMGIVVEVAGRKMQEDFEPVLERQIHYFINGASGIQHIGQRDIAWIRLADSAVDKGFTLEHFGKILHARFHADFGAIVDKVQVTIYTEPDPMNKWLEEAREAYNFRNQRLADLTDTAVNEFYSCTLCQSFAPDHVCIVSPERLGLCGAYNWLDCKASYSINPTGPNQPIKLGKLLDEEFGYWTGTLDYAKVGSHGAIEEVSMYSIMENPMTACLTDDVEVIVNNQAQPIGAVVEAASGAAPGAHLLTLNEAQKTAVSQLLGVHKNPAPGQLIRIKTKSGVTLTLTANHEVAVDRWGQNGRDPWVRADQLQVGDRVYALKQLRVHNTIPLTVDLLPADCRVTDEALLAEINAAVKAKYGSLAAGYRELGVKRPDVRTKSLPLTDMRRLLNGLDMAWDEWKKRITEVAPPSGHPRLKLPTLTPDLLYLLGLLAADGSLQRYGRYQCRVNFTNSNPALLATYAALYGQIFPTATLGERQKEGGGSIEGRQINSTMPGTDLYSNNFLLGILADALGIRRASAPTWELSRLITLPEAHIAAFLAGIFDGDGTVRLRLYNDQWPVGEGYLSHQNEDAARHLSLLLKRLGILSQTRRDRTVYKVEMHGANLRRFAAQIPARHPVKQDTLAQIAALPPADVDKTQEQLLPYKVGELLADLPASQTVLPKSTLFYYKTGRSRPTAGNVRRVIAEAPETAALLSPYLESDAFLDSITEIETIANQGDNRPYQYVYNLSLLDINSYLANGLHVKNCGCFECIVMYIPEVEGVMVVSREDVEMTPAGMKFSTLAGMAGGGVQTPGVMGVGKYYLLSPKFISADGGFKRTVWMSRNLKESMADELRAVAEREGIPDLIERIADSSKVTTVEALQEWVEEVNHPVLEMGSMVRATPERVSVEPDLPEPAETVEEAVETAPLEPIQPEAEMAAPTAVTPTPPPPDTPSVRVEVAPITAEPKEADLTVEPTPAAVEIKPTLDTPADLLAEAQAAALRQAQALQQAAQEALRQAELLGQARAAQPASPAEAVDSLRQALQAALAALGSTPPPTPAPQPAAAAPVEPVPAAAPAPPVPEKAPEPVVAKAPEPKVAVKPAPPPIKKEPVKEQPWLPAGSKIPLPKEKWVGKVREVTLGATAEDGGTRSHTVTIGGETAMPFMQFEGQFPHPSVVALEVRSQKPADWSPLLQKAWGQAMDDPAQWAQAAEQANADLIYLTLTLDDTPETAVTTVKSVLQASGLPLIVVGPGQAEKDNELIVPIAEATKGERLLLGICEDKNYRTIVAAAMANGHLVTARTAMDVNLAKQLNILISDMGMPLDRVVMDPTTGALGYGFEYGYSVMERLRLAALQGDGMTQLPMLVTPGEECWKTKEAKVGSGVPEEWGDWLERSVNWETITAVMLVESGANVVVLRHPQSVKRTRQGIADLSSKQ